MAGSLTKEAIEQAFALLDHMLQRNVQLIVGGGTAMFLAYRIPLATADVDAYPAGVTVEELDPLVKRVAKQQGLAPDWLNPYYATFAHVLPADYATRLVDLFRGKQLWVRALGLEDLLIMKCFAGRAKDRGHARALLRLRPDLAIVNRRIDDLCDRRVKGALAAADFLDDLLSEES